MLIAIFNPCFSLTFTDCKKKCHHTVVIMRLKRKKRQCTQHSSDYNSMVMQKGISNLLHCFYVLLQICRNFISQFFGQIMGVTTYIIRNSRNNGSISLTFIKQSNKCYSKSQEGQKKKFFATTTKSFSKQKGKKIV